MRIPWSGMVMLLGVLLPSMAWAQTPDPMRLIPAVADAFLKVENPRGLYDAIYNHEVFQDFLKIEAVAAFYETTSVRRLHQFLAYLEKELKCDRLDLLDRLAGGGVVLAAKFEPKEILVVIQSKDEELLKTFLALARKIIQQELTRQANKESISTRTYHDMETLHLGKNLHVAQAGPALLFSNQESVLHQALDLHRNGGINSLAALPEMAQVKGHLPKDLLVWGSLNLERVRQIPEVKTTLNTLGIDPVTMFTIGGVVDITKRSPYLAAGLAREGKNLQFRFAMPQGREGMSPVAAMLLPGDDRGTLPMLQPPRVLSSTSYYLDLGKFWEDRHKILNADQAKTIDKFEADTGKYLKGVGLGTILQQAGKYQRVVLTTPATSPYKVKPTVNSGSFALILDMRDPAFAKSMGTVLRGTALVAGFQYGLKMVDEKHGEHTLVTYYFPENGKFLGDDTNFRFNFSPCFTHVGDQFIISSTLELGKDLIDCLHKEAQDGTSPATQRTYVYGTGVAANLRVAEDLLITQAILSQALSATDAKMQFEELVHLVERLGQVNFETTYGPREFRIDIHWQYEKK